MKKILTLFAFLLAGFVSLSATADARAPDALVRDVTNEVLEIVRADSALRAGDRQRVVALAEEKVLPHFDFRRMTMLAVGPDWRAASPAQRDQLTQAFRTLLVRTYSNALTQYRDQTVEFRPGRFSPADTQVQVRTEIRQTGAQPIPIDYMLQKSEQGWKVFDVIVAGVSLVTNYRSSFAQEIRSTGVDGLIRSLDQKNRDLAGAPNA